MAGKKKDKAEMEQGQKKEMTDPVVASAIGIQLKRLYDQVAQEPVPDRFTKLLEKLAKQEEDERNRE